MGEYVSGDWPAHYSWNEALAEPPHGAQGAHEAVDDAVCQIYHGMSPLCRECGEPWPSEGTAFASRCASCDCPFWVYR